MATDAQRTIGTFIKELRTRRAMTQRQFAEALGTSQSAVVRMEKGEQNLSTAQLTKISDVLHHKIVSINKSTDFQIEGGHTLSGSVATNTSKNGALMLLCGALLNTAPTTIHGVPDIEEVRRLLEVFASIGVRVARIGEASLCITPPAHMALDAIDTRAAAKMRTTLMLLGVLPHYERSFAIPHAGGCTMGERTIAAHKHALAALGLTIETHDTHYACSHEGLSAAEIVMYEASDTATINALFAAARIPEKTIIKYCTANYQVQDVCFLLERFGVRIEGIGTTTLTVHGVERIEREVEHHVSEDPIESMMFIAAALVTGSTLTVTRCPRDFLEMEILKLRTMGARMSVGEPYPARNEKTVLVDITVHPSELVASPVKIHPLPYPGLNSDNIPFFAPIATQAEGTTLIHDWAWEGRAIYFTELNRLGADVKLADPHRVFVAGPTRLKAAQVVCPPALRPAVVVLIAMLAAEGTSVLRNVYSIARGYERIAERLNALGARITVLSEM